MVEERAVRWRLRPTVSVLANNNPFPLTFVGVLDGIAVRCGYCGGMTASLRRKRRLASRYTFYTHCSWCDGEQRIGGRLGARERLAEVNPQLADTVFAGG